MSGAMEYAMELDDLNLGSIPRKSLCVDHIEDSSIKNFIRNNYDDGFCDYCKTDRKVVELEDLMRYIIGFINKEYTDAANELGYISSEGGYIGEYFTERELLWELELEIEPDNLYEDITSSIADIPWTEIDYYGTKPLEELLSLWERFKNIIKHKSRYVLFDRNFNADQEVNKARTIIKHFDSSLKRFKLVKELDVNQILFRCRATTRRKFYKTASSLVAPSNNNAKYSNRFSPAGMGMFYGAFDIATAHAETVNENKGKNTYISVGKFQTKTKLRLLDLTKLPKLHSFFSPMRGKKHYQKVFLHDLVFDMSKNIYKDGQENLDYIPTQVITEYVRFIFKDKASSGLDGIIYPSAKKRGASSIVIFSDNEKSMEIFKMLDYTNYRLSPSGKVIISKPLKK